MSLRRLGYEYVPGPSGSQSDWVLEPKFAWKGQADYDAVADACTAWVRAQLVPRCGLVELKGGGYSTPSIAQHRGPVLLLVCGSAPGGDAGVWGRALCINDSTCTGSMFETIGRAMRRGWAVVVADPHQANGAPHAHLLELYQRVLCPSISRPLLILAHSYGAALSIGMLKAAEAARGAATLQHVTALALTDGMVWCANGWRGGAALLHEGLSALTTDDEVEEAAASGAGTVASIIEKRAQLRAWVDEVPTAFDPPSHELSKLIGAVGRNWVVSDRRLGARVRVEGSRVMATVSAAVSAHPSTTHAALDDVFTYLDRAAVVRRKRGRA